MTIAFYVVAALLLVVVVTRRFAPALAAVLGMAISASIGAWGAVVFSRGGAMTFLGRPLGEPIFFGGVALLFGFEALNLHLAIKRRRQRSRDESASAGE